MRVRDIYIEWEREGGNILTINVLMFDVIKAKWEEMFTFNFEALVDEINK